MDKEHKFLWVTYNDTHLTHIIINIQIDTYNLTSEHNIIIYQSSACVCLISK